MKVLKPLPEDHTMTNPRMSLLQLLDKAEAGADPDFPSDPVADLVGQLDFWHGVGRLAVDVLLIVFMWITVMAVLLAIR